MLRTALRLAYRATLTQGTAQWSRIAGALSGTRAQSTAPTTTPIEPATAASARSDDSSAENDGPSLPGAGPGISLQLRNRKAEISRHAQWNRELASLASSGRKAEMLALFERMKGGHVRPNAATYDIVISSLARTYKDPLAWTLYNEMRETRLHPRPRMFPLLLGALAPDRTGVQRAQALLLEMETLKVEILPTTRKAYHRLLLRAYRHGALPWSEVTTLLQANARSLSAVELCNLEIEMNIERRRFDPEQRVKRLKEEGGEPTWVRRRSAMHSASQTR